MISHSSETLQSFGEIARSAIQVVHVLYKNRMLRRKTIALASHRDFRIAKLFDESYFVSYNFCSVDSSRNGIKETRLILSRSKKTQPRPGTAIDRCDFFDWVSFAHLSHPCNGPPFYSKLRNLFTYWPSVV